MHKSYKSMAERAFEMRANDVALETLKTQAHYNVHPETQEQLKEETVLQEANRIIYGDREQTYGHPAKNFDATAALWNGYLRSKKSDVDFYFNATDVAHMMILLKMAREIHMHKRDNVVDMAGYAGCIQKMEDHNAQR